MQNTDLRKALVISESLDFLERGAYEFQIPGVAIPSGRKWYQRTDGSQFALMNMNNAPHIACRFDVERVDTFIPKLPAAIRVNAWEDLYAYPQCPPAIQTAFLEWILRTHCIAITFRDNFDYWEKMARKLKGNGFMLILFDRMRKPYFREFKCARSFRREIELCPLMRTGLIGTIEQLEAALC